jgi:alpha-tubulin suppressor-like RCC1 family protein
MTNISSLMAWGKGDSGQLGLGKTITLSYFPMPVCGLSNIQIKEVSCGALQTIALSEEGRIYQWGQYLRMISPTEIQKGFLYEPRQVTGVDNIVFTKISAGGDHSLAISDVGNVYSWGDGS